MRIENLSREERADGPRIRARVVWEGPHRGPDTLWFETAARFSADFEPAPEAFLLAAMPLAAGLGEPRLAIDGRVSLRLRDGLRAAMQLWSTWYPWCRKVPIEASGGFASASARSAPYCAGYLSGGVDSLSMLRRNRIEFSHGDPRAIREAIHLFGWHSSDFDGQEPRSSRLRAHGEQVARLERFAETQGLVLIPVRTNARTFHPSYPWSRDVAFGAGMIAAAHAFARRLTQVHFASGGYPGKHPPHGSHPMLDPLFSSEAASVVHGEPSRTRLEKVRTIASWPEGMSVLEVCLHHDAPRPGVVNCGRCEKCMRTMLELRAVGRLDAAITFPDRALLADRLREARLSGGYNNEYLRQTLDALEANGDGVLAKSLRVRMSDADRRDRRRGRWWRRAIRALRRGGAKSLGGA